MLHILDTDTLIAVVRGLKSAARRQVRERALELVGRCQQAQREGHGLGISAITMCELEFGARKRGRYDAEMGAVHKILMPFEVHDFCSVACAPHYGAIRYALETTASGIGAMDLLIASHVLGLDGILVTNNHDHFRRVAGLRLADW